MNNEEWIAIPGLANYESLKDTSNGYKFRTRQRTRPNAMGITTRSFIKSIPVQVINGRVRMVGTKNREAYTVLAEDAYNTAHNGASLYSTGGRPIYLPEREKQC